MTHILWSEPQSCSVCALCTHVFHANLFMGKQNRKGAWPKGKGPVWQINKKGAPLVTSSNKVPFERKKWGWKQLFCKNWIGNIFFKRDESESVWLQKRSDRTRTSKDLGTLWHVKLVELRYVDLLVCCSSLFVCLSVYFLACVFGGTYSLNELISDVCLL